MFFWISLIPLSRGAGERDRSASCQKGRASAKRAVVNEAARRLVVPHLEFSSLFPRCAVIQITVAAKGTQHHLEEKCSDPSHRQTRRYRPTISSHRAM